MIFRTLIAFLLLAPVASAQIVLDPATPIAGKMFTVTAAAPATTVDADNVETSSTLRWRFIGIDHRELDGGGILATALPAAPDKPPHRIELNVKTHRYRLVSVFIPDPAFPTDPTKAKIGTVRDWIDTTDKDWSRDVYVEWGDGPRPQPPQPVPPTPIPPKPEPDPTPPPVVTGKRDIVILYESEDKTWQQGILFTALRASQHGQYLKSKGHKAWIVDDDSPNESGVPAEIVATYKALGVPTPALFIVEQGVGTVLFQGPLPATANEVIDLVKKHGG